MWRDAAEELMTMARKPVKVQHDRARRLWDEVTEAHELESWQRVLLEEACRCANRLDELDDVIAGKGVLELMHLRVPHALDDDGLVTVEMTVDGVLAEARQQQNVLKQLLVSLRLPDAQTGKRPQHRGARGAYNKGEGKSKVSSLDRARAAKSS